jgi:O-antigen ligase
MTKAKVAAPSSKAFTEQLDPKTEQLVYWCDQVVEWGLIAIAFLTPLIFTISTGADIFNIPRLLFLRLVTIPVALAWVLRLFETREYYRLRTPMLWPALAVLVSWLVSSIFSLRPEVSFMGNYLRQEGFWLILNAILLFFIASSTLKTAKQVNRLIQALLWSGFVACIYGVLQFAGLDWVGWASSGRPFSTLGNPDFFPHFLIMLLPIAIMKFLHAPRTELKLYLFLFVALIAFNVVVAQTRGSYIGLIIALPVLAFFIGKDTYKANRWWLLVIGVGLAAFVAFLFLKTDFLSAVLRGGLQQTRFYIWLGGLAVFISQPFLGVGPDVLRIASPPNKVLTYSLLEPMNNPDRMHNQYLDELIMRGAVGFLVYMWMLVTFFVSSFRAWKRIPDRYWKAMMAGVAVGILAYCGQNIFAFGIVPTFITFWLMLGINMVIAQMDFTKPVEVKGKKVSAKEPADVDAVGLVKPRRVSDPLPILYRRGIYVLAGLILVFSGYWAIRMFDADLAYGAGEIAIQTAQQFNQEAQKQTDQATKDQYQQEANRQAQLALDSYARAVQLNPVEAGYRTATEGHTSGYGNLMYQFAMTSTDTAQKNALRDQARSQWEIALKNTMYLENVYMQIGRSYLDEANEKPEQRKELLLKAAQNFEAGAKADPGDYPLYFQLANLHTELGDLQRAVEFAEKGVTYAAPTADRNESLRIGAQANLNQGMSLLQAGSQADAQKYLVRAQELAEQLKGFAAQALQVNPEDTEAKSYQDAADQILQALAQNTQPPTP